MHAETESVDINLDGRDAGPLPAAQGAANEVYRVYMSERRCGDAGKGPSPEGLPLSGRHPAARTLAIDCYGRRRAPCLATAQWQRDPPRLMSTDSLMPNSARCYRLARSEFNLGRSS